MPIDLKTRLAEASASVADALREFDSMQGQLRAVQAERDKLTAELRALAQRNAELTAEIAALRPAARPAAPPPPPARPAQRTLAFAAEPERIAKLPTDFPTRAVNLGLDFGTHATKLVMQARGDARNWVPFLDAPGKDDGCPPFAVPSLVRLASEKLWFGREALRDRGGQLFRSLKVDVLPPSETGQWQKSVYPPGTTPQLLVACYLGWVLGRVKALLGRRLDDRFSLGIAAPMNHVEDDRLLESYLPMVNAAWASALAGEQRPVAQGDELSALRPRFEALLEQPVPSLKERRFIVFPETLAPMVSRMQDADSEEGLRLMIDMGAGTTEYSVSMITTVAGETAITCYADRSILLGGDHFNALDAAPAGDRAAREERLRSELLLELRRTFDAGFRKDMDNGRAARQRWADLEVMLSGGGLRRGGLEAAIRNDNVPARYRMEPNRYDAKWHSPRGLTAIGEPSGFRFGPDNAPFLAVAHGLALPRARWPKMAFPANVVALRDGYVETNWWRPAYLDDDS